MEIFMMETQTKAKEQQHEQHPSRYQSPAVQASTPAYQFPITPGKHSFICHYSLSNATSQGSFRGH